MSESNYNTKLTRILDKILISDLSDIVIKYIDYRELCYTVIYSDIIRRDTRETMVDRIYGFFKTLEEAISYILFINYSNENEKHIYLNKKWIFDESLLKLIFKYKTYQIIIYIII